MPYKILFFAFVGSEFGGIEQKIIAQFDALVALGVEIHMFLISKVTPCKTFAQEIAKRPGVYVLFNSPEKINNPWARRKEKFDLMTLALSKFDPESSIVYFRDPLADIFFLRFLKRNKAFIFVTEHQDIENTFARGKLTGNYFRNMMEIIWGKSVRKMVTGFVSVTTEIMDYEKSIAGDNGHFFETIGNGIDINKYPLRIPENDLPDNEIHIIFVGSGYRHHGLSCLIKSINAYYKSGNNFYEIKVKVAGDSPEMNKYRKLVKRFKLCSKISFLGNLNIISLNEIFNWAQIGMASMGLHKIGLSKSSTLKTREYFARGLPFFWNSFDDDFPVNYPYILHLDPKDNYIDISEIIKFTERISGDRSHPQKMRQYSIEHLSWSDRMKKLIAFFNKIIKEAH